MNNMRFAGALCIALFGCTDGVAKSEPQSGAHDRAEIGNRCGYRRTLIDSAIDCQYRGAISGGSQNAWYGMRATGTYAAGPPETITCTWTLTNCFWSLTGGVVLESGAMCDTNADGTSSASGCLPGPPVGPDVTVGPREMDLSAGWGSSLAGSTQQGIQVVLNSYCREHAPVAELVTACTMETASSDQGTSCCVLTPGGNIATESTGVGGMSITATRGANG
jgi:hypothetical protein